MSDLYKATLEKEQFIINSGYKLITIWENEWDKLSSSYV